MACVSQECLVSHVGVVESPKCSLVECVLVYTIITAMLKL